MKKIKQKFLLCVCLSRLNTCKSPPPLFLTVITDKLRYPHPIQFLHQLNVLILI